MQPLEGPRGGNGECPRNVRITRTDELDFERVDTNRHFGCVTIRSQLVFARLLLDAPEKHKRKCDGLPRSLNFASNTRTNVLHMLILQSSQERRSIDTCVSLATQEKSRSLEN